MYREIYFDGCNGWKLGELLEQLPEGAVDLNGDGLYTDTDSDGEVLYVPTTVNH